MPGRRPLRRHPGQRRPLDRTAAARPRPRGRRADPQRRPPRRPRHLGAQPDQPPAQLLDPCEGGTAYPRDADRTDRAAVLLQSEREAGGTGVAQRVARYRTAAAAEDAWSGYRRAVSACTTLVDEGTTTTFEVAGEESGAGVETFYVRRASACPGCAPTAAYFALQRYGDVVSVLEVELGEDGDPGIDAMLPFAKAVATRLTP